MAKNKETQDQWTNRPLTEVPSTGESGDTTDGSVEGVETDRDADVETENENDRPV